MRVRDACSQGSIAKKICRLVSEDHSVDMQNMGAALWQCCCHFFVVIEGFFCPSLTHTVLSQTSLLISDGCTTSVHELRLRLMLMKLTEHGIYKGHHPTAQGDRRIWTLYNPIWEGYIKESLKMFDRIAPIYDGGRPL